MADYIYDLETYPNCFLMTVMEASSQKVLCWEISDRCNESRDIINFTRYLVAHKHRLVGFNNVGFDYPILHMLCVMGNGDAQTLYNKAQAIITDQYGGNRWLHRIKPTEVLVPQIDLYLIHHFDNVARATSLKALEFAMRSDNIEDLPFEVGTRLTAEQMDKLREYNVHDVKETYKFYLESLPMIAFREELTAKYKRDFMNHNDTKIGKDYFTMRLEEAGVECYEWTDNGRQPKQTVRDSIHLKDAILPHVDFDHPEFKRVLNWLLNQTITETKGVFKDLTATVNGFTFVFGLGGVHGSIESETVYSDEDHVIIDLDVTSYYPSLAIKYKFHPEHLGETFCQVYTDLKDQRVHHAKGTPENAMLKLALNGVYGDSNNPYSIFYDPLFTMSITLNGQLLLCLLAEWLFGVDGLQLIQVNTDGLTIRVARDKVQEVEFIRQTWEGYTGLQLEEAIYSRMFIRDVNNYIAEYENGGVKRKGAYEYDRDWHQNQSALVVPKVAEEVLLTGTPIRETVLNWDNRLDFMKLVKVPKSSNLVINYPDWGDTDFPLQNTTRYYVSHDGGQLVKIMPPLARKPDEWRRISVESGWSVTPCNDIKDASAPINYDYYIQEVEKLVLGLL